MTRTRTPRLAFALTALALAGLSAAPTVQAAPPAALHSRKMAAKTVYVCKDCHAYYSVASAKKMGYKDDMGHTLVNMSKAPTGYLNGDTIKM